MYNSGMRLLAMCFVLCCASGACRAGEMYTFSYAATSGPVESFSFSFTTPTFVTNNSSPAFTPFAVTNGTDSWTMTQDLVVYSSPIGCFMFGTPFAGLGVGPFGPCEVAVGGPGVNQAAFFVTVEGSGLPSAAGDYPAFSFGAAFDTAAGFEDIGPSTGSMSLTITDTVPEPTGLSLMGFGLAALGARWLRRHRVGA